MKSEKTYYIYILASRRNGTLYTGVTSNIEDRINKHKKELYKGFTSKYKVSKLVYFEIYGNMNEAIAREKQLKNWKREWKIKLIEKENAVWRDLSLEL